MKTYFSKHDPLEFSYPTGFRTYVYQATQHLNACGHESPDHPYGYSSIVKIESDFNLIPLPENDCETCKIYTFCNCDYMQRFMFDEIVLYLTIDKKYTIVLERTNACDYLEEFVELIEYDNFVIAYEQLMNLAILIRERRFFYLPFLR